MSKLLETPEFDELRDSMLLSLDIYSNDQIIDLPIAIDETGNMNTLKLDSTTIQPQVPPQHFQDQLTDDNSASK